MSFRDKLNRSPAMTAGLVVVVIAAAIAYLYVMTRSNQMAQPKLAYYTVDEGKNLFTDDIDRVVPFEHEGKEAVRAIVYTCDDGKTTFVGYLQKLSPDAKKKAEAALAEAQKAREAGQPVQPPQSESPFGVLVKKPGTDQWFPSASEGGTIAQNVKCSNGGVLDVRYP